MYRLLFLACVQAVQWLFIEHNTVYVFVCMNQHCDYPYDCIQAIPTAPRVEDSGKGEVISEKKVKTSGKHEVIEEEVKRVESVLEHNRHREETGMKCLNVFLFHCLSAVCVQSLNHLISHQCT